MCVCVPNAHGKGRCRGGRGPVKLTSGGVRVRFCVRFRVVKVSFFSGFPVGNPIERAPP